jgi:hypothetical protein
MEKSSPEEKRLLLDEYLSWSDFDGVIILSPDWTVNVPLWPRSDTVDELVPESLLAKLINWQTIFESNYRWSEGPRPEGWLSAEAKDQWEQAVPDLVVELTTALEGRARLIVNLWPITPSDQNREFQEYQKSKKDDSERWRVVLEEAGIKLEWRSFFNDESGQRIKRCQDNGSIEP